jgi:hypothetical protein
MSDVERMSAEDLEECVERLPGETYLGVNALAREARRARAAEVAERRGRLRWRGYAAKAMAKSLRLELANERLKESAQLWEWVTRLLDNAYEIGIRMKTAAVVVYKGDFWVEADTPAAAVRAAAERLGWCKESAE